MREGSMGGVGSVGGNPKEYKGVLKIGFGTSAHSHLAGWLHRRRMATCVIAGSHCYSLPPCTFNEE
ncbi:hypothetical protein [Mastigocoleus testarum]|uniref:hypothetical protein n=1 Tax=Mastigocoleus testarum TaxID=996925 RepID=UPI00137B7514|nr:hypothetical protein [Mastigocoleus testarum]